MLRLAAYSGVYMKKHFLSLLMIVLLAFSTGSGCAASTPLTYGGGSPRASLHKDFTAEDMREAILRACYMTQWNATDASAGTIEARRIVGDKYSVVVSIRYTATEYFIIYKDSINMGGALNEEDDTYRITPKYNTWVGNLDRSIQAHIAQRTL